MFKVTKNDITPNNFTLYIPESFVYVENEMDVGLYVSFSKENLERIFKKSGFNVELLALKNGRENNLELNLGVFKFLIQEDDFCEEIRLWVVKGKE